MQNYDPTTQTNDPLHKIFSSKVTEKQLNSLTIIRAVDEASLTLSYLLDSEVTAETLQKSCLKIDTQQNSLATN